MPWLIIFILAQVVVAGIVVIVLRKLLEKELIEAALERLEVFKLAVAGEDIIIRFASRLDNRVQEQFESLGRRKFVGSKCIFEQDDALKGGVLIVIGQDSIDFSLTNRLKNFWS